MSTFAWDAKPYSLVKLVVMFQNRSSACICRTEHGRTMFVQNVAWYLTTKTGVQGCTSQKVIILIFTARPCLAWAVSCWPLIKEAWIQSQARPCGIISGKWGIGLGTLVVPSQYHTNCAPCSFIHSIKKNIQHSETLTSHTYTHKCAHIHIYICWCSFCNTIITFNDEKRGRNEGAEGMKGGRMGGRQLCVCTSIPQCFGHRTLFNLVHIYRTQMFFGPSFII